MIYGQLQYYNYELKAWSRLVDFHKTELNELITQLSILLSFPLVSLPDSKAANKLVELLMQHEQRFDDLLHHFEQQMQRLVYATINPDKLEPTVVHIQQACRGKVKRYEASFTRSRGECLTFLSAFFLPEPVATVDV